MSKVSLPDGFEFQSKGVKPHSGSADRTSYFAQANGFRLATFVLLLCLILALPVWAQKDAGSIVGMVRDNSGAVVADAKVAVTDVDRGTVFNTTTNSTGEYA